MLIAVDVYYRGSKARAVCMQFKDWQDESPARIDCVELDGVAEYTPGEFYKRELPCILKVLEKVDRKKIETIVVDGYVYLGGNGKPGLGAYLYKALKGKIPVIGVAKSRFYNNHEYVKEVYRGSSRNPLYITSTGVDPEEAARNIKKMKGARIPMLLKMLDNKTKEDAVTEK